MSVYHYHNILYTAIMVLWAASSGAQVLTTPVSMGSGGGGAAYITGYESLFLNPANLYIREKEYQVQITAGNFGTYLSSPVNYSDIDRNYKSWYFDQSTGFRPGHEISTVDIGEFLNRNYRNNRLISEHQTRGDFHLLGVQWFKGERAYAVGLRSRYSARATAGRSYYDSNPVEDNGLYKFNRSLSYRFQSYHELSFGYAETFTYIDGLIPQMSRLIIGIAPKVVLAGSYIDMDYRNRSSSSDLSGNYENSVRYRQQTSGEFNGMSNPWQSTGAVSTSGWQTPARKNLFNPTGFGAGIDIGLTYMITLGDDLSAIRNTEVVTRKSLRFSLSVTDIGLVRYIRQPSLVTSDRSVNTITPDYSESRIVYTGRPGEHHYFLNENEEKPQEVSGSEDRSDFTVTLPATIHAGTLVHMDWLKVMGDVSLGLTNDAFNTTRFTGYIGTEVRILSSLPLRAGTRIAPGLPGYYSFGGGYENNRFDFNVAVMLVSETSGITSELSGASLAALTVYLH